MDVTHLDVTTAFLNGQLKVNIFIHLLEDYYFSNSGNKVLRLIRAVYHLKQSFLHSISE